MAAVKAGATTKAAKKTSSTTKKTAASKKKAPAATKKTAAAKKNAPAATKKTAATKKKTAATKKKTAATKKKTAAATKKTAPEKASSTKVEKPKVEKPKVEKPKVEKPKVEKPKVEKPKVEGPAAANDDLPRAPTAYRVDFQGQHIWPTVVVGEHAFAGEPGRAPLCEAGKPLFVAYARSAEDLHARGTVSRVELGYRVPGGEPRMLPITTSPVRIDVPVNAAGELELWFRLTTTDGRVLWDSDFARNHRVEIVPAGEIWALFEGERSA